MNPRRTICALLLMLSALQTAGAASKSSRIAIDHHQHLMNAAMAESPDKAIDADKLIAMLDAAGIQRAVLLSNAFMYREYEQVKAENDWTLAEASKYPKRLVVFCGLNPLEDFALGELDRCAHDKRFGRGIKLQFAASDVNLDDEADVGKVRKVFEAANQNRMAIVVHMRTRRARPYGATQAETFITRLLQMAPDVPVQIAHFTGGGNANDTAADEALRLFIPAIKRGDPRVKNLYFDLALVVPPDTPPERREWVAQRIRDIGVEHILYGSDGGDPTDPPPKVTLQAFHSLPLTKKEFAAIEKNVAPYLR